MINSALIVCMYVCISSVWVYKLCELQNKAKRENRNWWLLKADLTYDAGH